MTENHASNLLHTLLENNIARIILDGLSYATITAVIMEKLPHIASLLSIVWFGICIWESKTVKGLVRCVREKIFRI